MSGRNRSKKEKISTSGHDTFLTRAAAMTLNQGIQVVVPFVAIAIMTGSLGLASYGEVAVIQSYFIIISMILEYSLNLVAVREIRSRAPLDQTRYLSDIFWLRIFSAFILSSLYCMIVVFRRELELIDIIIISVVPYSFVNNWYFISRGEGIKILLCNGLPKLFFVASLLVLEYYSRLTVETYSIAYMISNIFVALVSIFCIATRVCRPDKAMLARQIEILRSGAGVFLAVVSSSSYRTLPVAAMGSVGVNPEFIGAYSILEKIARAPATIIQPISQALQPSFIKMADSLDVRVFLKKANRALASFCFIVLAALLFIACFLDEILRVFSLNATVFDDGPFHYLFLLPLVICFGNVYGNLVLLSSGQKGKFNAGLYFVGSVSAPLILVISIVSYEAIPIFVVICEALVSMIFFKFARAGTNGNNK